MRRRKEEEKRRGKEENKKRKKKKRKGGEEKKVKRKGHTRLGNIRLLGSLTNVEAEGHHLGCESGNFIVETYFVNSCSIKKIIISLIFDHPTTHDLLMCSENNNNNNYLRYRGVNLPDS